MEKTSTLRSQPSSVSLIPFGVMLPLVVGMVPHASLAQSSPATAKQAQGSTTLPKLKDRGAPVGRQRGGASQNSTSGALPKLKDRGAPTGRRRGGASRNDCPTVSKPLTALVPGTEDPSGTSPRSVSYLASTVAPYPTFWVYIPSSEAGKSRVGEFVLQNKAGDDLYRTSLALPSTSGSIGIKLPQKPQYALQLDQEYHWYFQLYCGDPAAQPEYFYVDAWVKRVSATAAPQNSAPSANTATSDVLEPSQEGLWYDTLTQSAQSQTENWSNLLKQVGLQDIAGEPIVQQFSPQ